MTLYQTLFSLEMSLVNNYNLTYFEIEKSRFKDFCEYVSQLNDYYELEEMKEKEAARCKDDSWF